MSLAVLIAFASALAAAVGTGVLIGRFIRAPRSDLAAWSSVLLTLAVALGAQAMGFAIGFTSATFRTVQLAGLLIAPLWLAWGLVELAGRTVPARFSMRLVTAALTVVPGVILILDPLNSAPVFGKAWPGEKRYMVLPTTALTGIHVIAAAIALLMMFIVAIRTRRDPAWWDVFVPAVAAGAAVLLTVGLGFKLPNVGYPLLTVGAACAVWFAVSRSERVRLDQLRVSGFPGTQQRPQPGRRRRGQAPLDFAGFPGAIDDPASGPLAALATDGFPLSRDLDPPVAASAASVAPPPPPLPPPPLPPLASSPLARPAQASPAQASPAQDWPAQDWPAQDWPAQDWPAQDWPAQDWPAQDSPPLDSSPLASAAAPQGAAGTPVVSELFGLIAIYTLLEGRGEEFDGLAKRTVEAVRAQEPDTLLFVVHTVPKAPMQRIFYEVYRDRMAYRDHRLKPQVEDFFARYRPYVLATNVVELDLRYAKVSALPSLGAMFSRDGGVIEPEQQGGRAR